MIPERLLPISTNIGSTLGNHLWQSTVFAVIVWLMALLLRRNRSSLRYGLWVAASLKFLIPFSLLVSVGTIIPKALPAAMDNSDNSTYSAFEYASRPFDYIVPTVSLERHPGSMEPFPALLPEFLVAIWLFGTITVSLIWYRRWRQVSTVLRNGELATCGREVAILRKLESETEHAGQILLVRSREMMEPGVFGIYRPTLLWPARLTVRLEDEHVRAILAHELMHVRRKDNLMAALHMLVEAVFWFHPIVWWMESRMVQERERSCDEEVVEMVGGPEVYAESLLRACRFCLESPLACVSGIAGANFRNRMIRIMTNERGVRLSLTRKLLLSAAALAFFAVPMAIGAIGAMQAQGSLLHPTDSPLPTFEVATIKPNKNVQAGMRIALSPSNFMETGGSVQEIIGFAFNVNSSDQLDGQPSWISSQRFDITAKASEDEIAAIHRLPAMQQITEVRLMMQSLLADRFKLKVSFKTAERPVYALVIAKGGPKLKEVQVDPLPPPGMRPQPGAHIPSLGRTGANEYTATAWDMPSMADFLSRFDEVGHRVVVDETGLKGHYDFVLSGISVGPSADGTTTSIFTALKEQLDLELVPRKAPVEVLVIDRIEPPSEN